nr:hypothetical protein [Leptolyngbya sp. FACHB-36]
MPVGAVSESRFGQFSGMYVVSTVLFGSAMAGFAGGYLSLVYTPLWSENMTAGLRLHWLCLPPGNRSEFCWSLLVWWD